MTHKGVRPNARGRPTNVRGRAVVFSPDGRRLATTSDGDTARIWDATSGQQLITLTHDNVVVGVAFSPDGCRLATASDDHTARIWDATNGQQLTTLTHDKPVRAVAFSPDGHRLATASDDKTARIWDTTSGQQLAAVTHDDSVQAPPVEERTSWRSQLAWVARKGWVQGVAFSPDGQRLATASDDHTARIWVLGDDE